jgi:hypothetical protein
MFVLYYVTLKICSTVILPTQFVDNPHFLYRFGFFMVLIASASLSIVLLRLI